MVTMADLEQAKYAGNGNKRPSYQEAKMMWPTPQANKTTPNTSNPEDLVNSSGEPWQIGEKPYDRRTGKPVTTCLGDAVKMWPTPSASDGTGGPGCSGRDGGENLRTAVKRLPTPTQRDWRSGTGASPREGHAPQLPEVVGCQLSADWVSLLMGFPVDWTIIGDQDGKTEPPDSPPARKIE
jgi:hypothetical protein